ncbi:hypothetical protein Sjap_007298 [Stephania japonica]|uniref:Uncharacterized protein n=1 Tax=Stephania japonica TaxID=461633 RepID=A0AAP0PB61_9MAGN
MGLIALSVQEKLSDFAMIISNKKGHWIQFREGEFEKHYETLLQCDERLLMLSQMPFPYHDSPFFQNKNKNLSGNEEFSFEFIGHQPVYTPAMQSLQFSIQQHLPAFFHQPTQTFQPLLNVIPLNSSLPSYMMGRENQVREQPLYAYLGYPNQADHAFPKNASCASNFQAVEDHLMSYQVAQ